MVTGGEKSSYDYIDTTEVYDSNLDSWVTSEAKLPRPWYGLKATTIDGRVLIFGNCQVLVPNPLVPNPPRPNPNPVQPQLNPN